MKILREYVRELLREDHPKRAELAQELTLDSEWRRGRSSAPEDAVKYGRILKKLFHKYADKSFLDSLITIHWSQDPGKVMRLLKASRKDELSTNAYLPGEVDQGDYGFYGLLVKGHISLLANNMDDVVTGYQDIYKGLPPEREKSSGINKGVIQALPPEQYAEGDFAPIVLDRKDWNPVGAEVGIYGNEALVDNWKPVALVVSDVVFDEGPPSSFKVHQRKTGLPIVRPSEIGKGIK